MITLFALNQFSHIRHAFFTREGGHSSGIYASLNCGPGSKDDPAMVAANRAHAMELLEQPASALVTLHQAHTANVVHVTAPFVPGQAPVADGMVTNCPGLVLGILTADCAPVLFTDSQGKAIGAAHAGWKGAVGGVLEATVAAMVNLGAEANTITAVIGPCIAQRSYEVGPEFPQPFLTESQQTQAFFQPSRRQGHWMFDLRGYVAWRLAKTGVKDILSSPGDTCSEESRFFSYRRSMLRGEPDYGRQLSAIVLDSE